MDPLARPLVLPCGVRLAGRVCKAAMTEGVADELGRATEMHERLYGTWAEGNNAGHLLITGNVQIDRRYLERPGNVCVDGPQSEEALERLRKWAKAAQRDGTKCFVQLGHAGRQATALVNLEPVAPSAVELDVTGASLLFGKPRALTADEVRDVVHRFAYAARVCRDVGFAGVQIHSAHGYLLSSFLSAKANRRTDEFGGALENRARVLYDVVRAVRDAVGKDFAVSVKLNSSDFQKGGFDERDAVLVAQELERLGVDLLEVSGGSYENPAMMVGGSSGPGDAKSEWERIQSLGHTTSTQLREGYFLVFAEEIRRSVKTTPIMVTGGFRSRDAMVRALESGACDVIGVGRPLCGDPRAVSKLLRGVESSLPRFERDLDLPVWLRWAKYAVFGNLLRMLGTQAWTYDSLLQLARGKNPETETPNLLWLIVRVDAHERDKARRLKLAGVRGLETNREPTSPLVWAVRLAVASAVLGLVAVKARKSWGG